MTEVQNYLRKEVTEGRRFCKGSVRRWIMGTSGNRCHRNTLFIYNVDTERKEIQEQ